MTNTKTILKALLGASALTVFATGTAQAQNNFTPAGTNVQNTFTLDYNVGGVAQPQIDNVATPTEFTVDRLIDLTVASNGDTTVAPGATDQELVFSVTNEGNDDQAYDLSFVEETEATDPFDTDPASSGDDLVYYVDDGNGTFEPGGADGSAVVYDPANPPVLAPDEVLWVVVVQDVDAAAEDGDEADVTLVADTLDPVTFAEVLADGDLTNVLTGAAENVLADDAGANDVANAGDHSATATYIVASAEITGTKVVTIHSEDGSTCATFPGTATGGYGLPGSCVEYVIEVVNAGSVAATDIEVSDTLPAELTYVATDLNGFTGGTLAALAANTDCAGSACLVELTGATLAAPTGGATSTSGTVTIRAIVK